MRTSGRGRFLARFRRTRCAECGKPAKDLYCDVCGQQHLERMRDVTLRSHQHSW